MPASTASLRRAQPRAAQSRARQSRARQSGDGRRYPDAIGKFFASLAEPGQLATFAGQSATLRFDVLAAQRREHWYVTVTDGNVAVTHSGEPADAVIKIGKTHLEAIVTGRMNAQAASLRGLLSCEGRMAAFIMFQRCLPGPPGSTGRVAPISPAAVMAQRRPA